MSRPDRKAHLKKFLAEVGEHADEGRGLLKYLVERGLLTRGEYKLLISLIAELEVAMLDIDFLWDRKEAVERERDHVKTLLKRVTETEGAWSWELEQAVRLAVEE